MSTTTVREASLIIAVVGGFALLVLVALQAGQTMPALVVLPLVVPLCLAGAYVMALAGAGSTSAILAFFVVMLFVNDAVFRVRAPGDIGLDWQNGLKFVLWAGAAAIGLANLGRVRIAAGGASLAFFGVYILACLASAAYSASPLYSFATALGLASMPLLSLVLAERVGERHLLATAALVLTLFAAVGWVVYFAVPELGRSPFVTKDGLIERFCGIAGQANSLGKVMAVYLAILFLLWHRGHWRVAAVLPLAAFGLFTLLAADSRSSLLALLVGIALVLARQSLWRLGLALLALVAGLILLETVPLRQVTTLLSGASRSGDPTEVFTLTGRTELWEFVWERILAAPWLGYGYNAGKFVLPQFLGIGTLVEDAHNMWLQNLLSVGAVGTLPLALASAALLVDYLRWPSPMRDLVFGMVMVYGMTSSGAFGVAPNLLSLVLFIGIALAATERESTMIRGRPA